MKVLLLLISLSMVFSSSFLQRDLITDFSSAIPSESDLLELLTNDPSVQDVMACVGDITQLPATLTQVLDLIKSLQLQQAIQLLQASVTKLAQDCAVSTTVANAPHSLGDAASCIQFITSNVPAVAAEIIADFQKKDIAAAVQKIVSTALSCVENCLSKQK